MYETKDINLLFNNIYFIEEVKDLIKKLQSKNIDVNKIDIEQYIEYVLDKCEDDFLLFCKIFFPFVSVGNGNLLVHQGTEILCKLMTLIQQKKISQNKIVLINIMPRSGKTLTCDTLFTAWCFSKGDNIIEKSYTSSKGTATEKHELFNNLIKSSLYKYYIIKHFPKSILKINTEATFITPTTYKTSKTILTSAIGGDANFIIADDPNNPQVFAGKECEKVINVFSKSLSTRNLGVKDASPNIVIQQRVSPNDLSGWLLEYQKENLIHICLKEYEENDVEIKIPLKDGTIETIIRKAGHLRNDKEFLDFVELKKKEPYTYQALYQQNPAMAEQDLLFRNDMFYYYSEYPKGNYKDCFITADMSIDGKLENDYTAIGYWEVIDNKLVLKDLVYNKFDSSIDRVNLLAEVYARNQLHKPIIILENVQANKWLARDLKSDYNIKTELVERGGQNSAFAGSKKARLLSASQYLSTNIVYLPIEYKQKIQQELNLITIKTIDDVHDDFADILADAITIKRFRE